jgi:hypothetical protein
MPQQQRAPLKEALLDLLNCTTELPPTAAVEEEAGFLDLRALLARAASSSAQRTQALAAGLSAAAAAAAAAPEAPWAAPSPAGGGAPPAALPSQPVNATVEREAAEIRARVLGQKARRAPAPAGASAPPPPPPPPPLPPPFHSRTAAAAVGEAKAQPLSWREQIAVDLAQPLRALLARGTAPAAAQGEAGGAGVARGEEGEEEEALVQNSAFGAGALPPPPQQQQQQQQQRPAPHLLSATLREIHNTITPRERAITAALLRKYAGGSELEAAAAAAAAQEPTAEAMEAHRQPLAPLPTAFDLGEEEEASGESRPSSLPPPSLKQPPRLGAALQQLCLRGKGVTGSGSGPAPPPPPPPPLARRPLAALASGLALANRAAPAPPPPRGGKGLEVLGKGRRALQQGQRGE